MTDCTTADQDEGGFPSSQTAPAGAKPGLYHGVLRERGDTEVLQGWFCGANLPWCTSAEHCGATCQGINLPVANSGAGFVCSAVS